MLELLDAVWAQLEAKPAFDAQYVKSPWLIFGPARWRAKVENFNIEIERRVYASPMAGLIGTSHAVSLTIDGESFARTFMEGPNELPISVD